MNDLPKLTKKLTKNYDKHMRTYEHLFSFGI